MRGHSGNAPAQQTLAGGKGCLKETEGVRGCDAVAEQWRRLRARYPRHLRGEGALWGTKIIFPGHNGATLKSECTWVVWGGASGLGQLSGSRQTSLPPPDLLPVVGALSFCEPSSGGRGRG